MFVRDHSVFTVCFLSIWQRPSTKTHQHYLQCSLSNTLPTFTYSLTDFFPRNGNMFLFTVLMMTIHLRYYFITTFGQRSKVLFCSFNASLCLKLIFLCVMLPNTSIHFIISSVQRHCMFSL